jgi:hypothetical protein
MSKMSDNYIDIYDWKFWGFSICFTPIVMIFFALTIPIWILLLLSYCCFDYFHDILKCKCHMFSICCVRDDKGEDVIPLQEVIIV